MERYYNDDDEDSDNEPFFGDGDEDDEDTIAFINQQSMLDAISLDQRLMDQAITVASANWLWRFRGAAYKLDQIRLIYDSLYEMTAFDKDIEPEEDE